MTDWKQSPYLPPGSALARVMNHPVAPLGMPALMLIDASHPDIARSFQDYVDGASNPIERLHFTVSYSHTVSRGTVGEARSSIGQVNRAHAGAKKALGFSSEHWQHLLGVADSASMWGYLAAIEHYGPRKTDYAWFDAAIGERAQHAAMLGMKPAERPQTWQQLQDDIDRICDELVLNDSNRPLVETVRRPPLSHLRDAAWLVMDVAAAALAPPKLAALHNLSPSKFRAQDALLQTVASKLSGPVEANAWLYSLSERVQGRILALPKSETSLSV